MGPLFSLQPSMQTIFPEICGVQIIVVTRSILPHQMPITNLTLKCDGQTTVARFLLPHQMPNLKKNKQIMTTALCDLPTGPLSPGNPGVPCSPLGPGKQSIPGGPMMSRPRIPLPPCGPSNP